MKLPPLPKENTPRLYIDYTNQGQQHTLHLRLPVGTAESAAAAVYTEVTTILNDGMYQSDSFTGARFSVTMSKLAFPLNVLPVQGAISGTPDPTNKPNFLSWTGRSAAGYRTKVTYFCTMAEGERYRIPASNPGWWTNMLAYLRNAPTVAVRAVDGNVVIWNNYSNQGVNAYYQRKQRRVG